MQSILTKLPPAQRANLIAGVFFAATLALGLIVSNVAQDLCYASKCAQVKQNLHAIQLALERYSVDNNGDYPSNIAQLKSGGYLPVLPKNPFTGKPMRCVREAPHGEADGFVKAPAGSQRGDFIYHKEYFDRAPTADNAEPIGYQLVAYF
jgi:hypothetical protein